MLSELVVSLLYTSCPFLLFYTFPICLVCFAVCISYHITGNLSTAINIFGTIHKKATHKLCGFAAIFIIILSFMSENNNFADYVIEDKHHDTCKYLCYPKVHIEQMNACPHHKCFYEQGYKSSAVE